VNDDFNQILSDLTPLELSVDETSTSVGSFVGSLAVLRGRNESQFYYLVNETWFLIWNPKNDIHPNFF